MKKVGLMSLIIVLLFMMGCTKKNTFELPNDELTISKNVSDIESCFNGIRYEPLIISDEQEKIELIDYLNSWKLVEDNTIYKPSCGLLYSITWENHTIDIFTINEKSMNVRIDGESYKVVGGNMDFLDEYPFQKLD